MAIDASDDEPLGGCDRSGRATPSPANLAKQASTTSAPAATRTPPTTSSASRPGGDPAHPVISQGTSPAITPGASTRKTVEPSQARTRPQKVRSMIARSGPRSARRSKPPAAKVVTVPPKSESGVTSSAFAVSSG